MSTDENRYSVFHSASITVATNSFRVHAGTVRPKYKYVETELEKSKQEPPITDSLASVLLCMLTVQVYCQIHQQFNHFPQYFKEIPHLYCDVAL